MSVSKQITLTKNCESVPIVSKNLEPLSENVSSNNNRDGNKRTDIQLSESQNSFINNLSIMQAFTSEENENDTTGKCSLSVSLPNVFYPQENYGISVDLQDWYFDDELQLSLQNDPNMQLITSRCKELEIVNSSLSSSIFDDTGNLVCLRFH